MLIPRRNPPRPPWARTTSRVNARDRPQPWWTGNRTRRSATARNSGSGSWWRPRRSSTTPSRWPTTVAGAVRITFDVQAVTDAVRNVTIGIVVIGIGGLLAGMLIALRLAGSLARPLTALSNTAKRLGDGDLSARAGTIKGPREVEDLSHVLRRDGGPGGADVRSAAIVRGQRVPSTADAAHRHEASDRTGDRRRPATPTNGTTSKRPTTRSIAWPSRRPHAADGTRDRGRRTHPGRPARGDRERGRSMERPRLRPGFLDRPRRGRRRGARPSEPRRRGPDRGQPDRQCPRVCAGTDRASEQRGRRPASSCRCAITDPGIPTEEQQKVTERFYRGQGSPPGGSGLGLAIARDLAEKWGGDLAIVNPDDGGTRVDVRFRRVPSSRTPRATPAPTEAEGA